MESELEFAPGIPGAFLVRLAIDLAAVVVLIRLIYFRRHGRSDLFLTYFAFNIVIFLSAYALNGTKLTIGAAAGLFAVFSMLRYRTEGISTTDMTYLFLVIALGMTMAIGNAGPLQLGLMGASVLGLVAILESGWVVRRELRQTVLYDNIDLVNAHAHEELIRDLRDRTGLNVQRVEIREIDLLKDSARLIVYYPESDPLTPRTPGSTIESSTRVRYSGAFMDQRL